MTELELGDIRPASLGDHLVTKTNAEYGNLAQKILYLAIGLFDGFGVAGAVRQEDSVGIHCKNLFGGGVPGHNRKVAANANQALEDGLLCAAIVGHDVVSKFGSFGKRESLGLGKLIGAHFERYRA